MKNSEAFKRFHREDGFNRGDRVVHIQSGEAGIVTGRRPTADGIMWMPDRRKRIGSVFAKNHEMRYEI